MHASPFYYIVIFLVTQSTPYSFAGIVPVPKVPKVPNVANEGTAGGSAAGARAGEEACCSGSGTSRPHSGALTEGDITNGGSSSTKNGKEDIGEIFEKVLDIIKEAMPTSSDASAAATITPGPVPKAAVTDRNARACLQADDIYSSCAAQTSGFDGNNYSYQASCLCYWTSSGMVGWQPQTYDALMGSCYNYINTQSGQVTAASDVRVQASLCTSVGDVRKSRAIEDASLQSYYATAYQTLTSTGGSMPQSTSGTTSKSVGGMFLSTKLKSPFRTVANVHDTKPPIGIPVGYLTSIELEFTLLPLHSILPQNLSGQTEKQKGHGGSSRLRTQCHEPKRVLIVKLRVNLALAKDNDDLDGDTLFRSLGLESDTEMLDSNEDGPSGLRFLKREDRILAHGTSTQPAIDDEASIRDIPSTLQPTQPSLANFIRLIDASFRHTISGTRSPNKRIDKVTPILKITLAKATSNPSLGDISPPLFRPGYMKAIADRAHLISRIASSISNICSRSRPSLQPTQSEDLQTKLWHLLQKRRWPTQDLEPVSRDDLLAFTTHTRARQATLFDSDQESDGAGIVKEVEEEEEEGDKDMLDNCSGMVEEEDEDLFSSYETTPFSSSQERGADEVMMMLEEEEDRGEKEEMLLEEDGCTFLQFAKAQHPQLEGMVIDSSSGMGEGMEDGESRMLF
ncbi:MAG: hypothetical protein Q9179_001603 [Wetmoreana sp. 5 TL-2023]